MRETITVLAAAAVLVSCGQATEGQAPATTEPTASQPADQPAEQPTKKPPAKKPAPKVPTELRFTAKTLDGKPFDGKSLAGKPAMLWFWAPWCPRCNREAPTIAKAAESHGERVTFVGVAANDKLPAMQQFAEKYGFEAFTNLNDEHAAVWAKFGVTYQPAFAFISADGKVDVVKGELPESELTAKLDALAG